MIYEVDMRGGSLVRDRRFGTDGRKGRKNRRKPGVCRAATGSLYILFLVV